MAKRRLRNRRSFSDAGAGTVFGRRRSRRSTSETSTEGDPPPSFTPTSRSHSETCGTPEPAKRVWKSSGSRASFFKLQTSTSERHRNERVDAASFARDPNACAVSRKTPPEGFELPLVVSNERASERERSSVCLTIGEPNGGSRREPPPSRTRAASNEGPSPTVSATDSASLNDEDGIPNARRARSSAGAYTPSALAATGASSAPRSVSRRAAYLSAVVHLARHAPASASFQFGERTLPLLPEAAATLAAKGSPFADKDALAAAVVLVASFFADPRGGKALETHADAHAGAMLQALCALAGAAGEETEKDPGILASMEVRETALEALVAATSLPFSAVYPHRRVVAAAATAALDDPKRRVRRAAARCREVWLALDAKS